MKKTKIKKNDQVLVISGKDRGSKGKVLRVFPARELAIVERVNMVKRHTRQNAQKGIRQADGTGVRVAKKSGATLN